MKKIFKLMMALMVAIVATGFVACSKDDDGSEGGGGEGGSNGKMVGWVKIGDQKYDLKYCWDLPDEDPSDNAWSILAASKDIDKKTLIKDHFNMIMMTLTLKSNGTWEYDNEFMTDFSYFDESKLVGYWFDGTDAIIEKNGDSFMIKGDNISMQKYTEKNGQTVTEGTVTGSFYFSGKPGTLKNTIVE